MENDDKIKELTAKINKTSNEAIDQIIEIAFDRGRLTSDSPSIAKKEMLALVAPFKHKEESQCYV
jgi:hypothetical protein